MVSESSIEINGVKHGSLSTEARNGRAFARITPPGTWVWRSSAMDNYGVTIDGEGVYKDPKKDYVVVGNVNKRQVAQTWKIESIINMTPDQVLWKNLDLALNVHKVLKKCK